MFRLFQALSPLLSLWLRKLRHFVFFNLKNLRKQTTFVLDCPQYRTGNQKCSHKLPLDISASAATLCRRTCKPPGPKSSSWVPYILMAIHTHVSTIKQYLSQIPSICTCWISFPPDTKSLKTENWKLKMVEAWKIVQIDPWSDHYIWFTHHPSTHHHQELGYLGSWFSVCT